MTDPPRKSAPNGPDPTAPRWDDWPHVGPQAPGRALPDLSPLLALFDALRRMVPPDLQAQLNALQREFLLTVRALIDWYLERLDAHAREPEVEDIPID